MTPKTTPIRLDEKAALNPRHQASFALLAAAAGAVNACALMLSGRFITHVSGTATRLGTDLDSGAVALEAGAILFSFIVGAGCSVWFLQARTMRGEQADHSTPLYGVAGVLLFAAVVGHRLELDGPVLELSEVALLTALAFAMGLMNATVASSTSLAIRTTHMTGPATDFGVQLAIALAGEGEARRHALRIATLRGAKILAFCAGAALIVPVVQRIGALAFIAPSLLVMWATARSFANASVARPAAQLQREV